MCRGSSPTVSLAFPVRGHARYCVGRRQGARVWAGRYGEIQAGACCVARTVSTLSPVPGAPADHLFPARLESKFHGAQSQQVVSGYLLRATVTDPARFHRQCHARDRSLFMPSMKSHATLAQQYLRACPQKKLCTPGWGIPRHHLPRRGRRRYLRVAMR